MADQVVRAVIGAFGYEPLTGLYTTNDGVALSNGDSVLALNAPSPTDRLIWLASSGPWTPKSVTYTPGMDVRVLESPIYKAWRVGLYSPTSGTITPGAAPLVWAPENWRDVVQPGTGLKWSGNGPGGLELPPRIDVEGDYDAGPLSLSLTDRGVVESISVAYGRMACIVSRSSVQSIPHDATATAAGPSWTTVNWDTESVDTDNMHSNATNPSRITVDGFIGTLTFHVSAFLLFAANTTGVRRVRILKNGTTTVVQDVTAAANASQGPLNPSHTVEAVAGDYFEVQVTQNSGAALDLSASSTFAVAASPS